MEKEIIEIIENEDKDQRLTIEGSFGFLANTALTLLSVIYNGNDEIKEKYSPEEFIDSLKEGFNEALKIYK